MTDKNEIIIGGKIFRRGGEKIRSQSSVPGMRIKELDSTLNIKLYPSHKRREKRKTIHIFTLRLFSIFTSD